MRFLSKGALAAISMALAGVGPATAAVAAETSSSEFVIIREDTVFPGDLYAGAIRVIVDGTLEGDLVAFAAEEVVIDGTVTGSVTAVAPSVIVNGVVGDSLRMSGSSLHVSGEVGGDVVAATIDVRLAAPSVVDGDVLLWSWDARALGTVGSDLAGTFRRLAVAGTVRGDVDVTVAKLTVVDDLVVAGDLGYRSDSEAEGLESAEVDGVVVDKRPLPPNLRVRALWVLGRFLVVIVLSVVALTVAYGWPRRTASAVDEVRRRPLRRWTLGAAVLFSPLLVAAATGVMLGLAPAAAAFPLLAVLLPLIFALLGLVFALSLVAGVPTVGWLGRRLFARLDLYGGILVGSITAGVVWYLPLIGWLVPVAVLPVGLGAWIATLKGQPASGSVPSRSIEDPSS